MSHDSQRVGSEKPPDGGPNGRDRNCIRCGSPATLRLRKTFPSCTPCAIRGFGTRAKPITELARGAALWDRTQSCEGSHRAREAGGVALAFSGGPNSRALLDVVTKQLRPPPLSDQAATAGDNVASSSGSSSRNERARPVEVTRIDVVYIDDSAVVPGARDQTEEVKQIVEEQGGAKAGLRLVALRLEDVFEVNGGSPHGAAGVTCLVGPGEARRIAATQAQTSERSPRQLLQDLFSSIHSPATPRASQGSARTRIEDIHYILTQRLLRQAARRAGCRALLLGDTGSRGSIRLMESLSKGGAHKWPVDGAASIWIDDLLVLRPLRDALSKEVGFYNRIQGLRYLIPADTVTDSVLSGKAGGGMAEKASIGRLTENFIFALEKGVPSTVSTVGRTGAKLKLKGGDAMGGSLADSLRDSKGQESNESMYHSGVGQKGDVIMKKVVRDVPRWSAWGRRGQSVSPSLSHLPLPCPLCGLPAQPGASAWRGSLSIRDSSAVAAADKSASPEANATAEGTPSGDVTSEWQRLDVLLCYSCLVILDIASGDEAPSPQTSPDGTRALVLPLYVLEAVHDRQKMLDEMCASTETPMQEHSSQTSSSDAEAEVDGVVRGLQTTLHLPKSGREAESPADPSSSIQRHVTRKIGRDEMQSKVSSFLL
ncbi:unnamed protein product [Parajaminaea phylloscopi]